MLIRQTRHLLFSFSTRFATPRQLSKSTVPTTFLNISPLMKDRYIIRIPKLTPDGLSDLLENFHTRYDYGRHVDDELYQKIAKRLKDDSAEYFPVQIGRFLGYFASANYVDLNIFILLTARSVDLFPGALAPSLTQLVSNMKDLNLPIYHENFFEHIEFATKNHLIINDHNHKLLESFLQLSPDPKNPRHLDLINIVFDQICLNWENGSYIGGSNDQNTKEMIVILQNLWMMLKWRKMNDLDDVSFITNTFEQRIIEYADCFLKNTNRDIKIEVLLAGVLSLLPHEESDALYRNLIKNLSPTIDNALIYAKNAYYYKIGIPDIIKKITYVPLIRTNLDIERIYYLSLIDLELVNKTLENLTTDITVDFTDNIDKSRVFHICIYMYLLNYNHYTGKNGKLLKRIGKNIFIEKLLNFIEKEYIGHIHSIPRRQRQELYTVIEWFNRLHESSKFLPIYRYLKSSTLPRFPTFPPGEYNLIDDNNVDDYQVIQMGGEQGFLLQRYSGRKIRKSSTPTDVSVLLPQSAILDYILTRDVKFKQSTYGFIKSNLREMIENELKEDLE